MNFYNINSLYKFNIFFEDFYGNSLKTIIKYTVYAVLYVQYAISVRIG